LDFAEKAIGQMNQFIAENGCIVLVIGDVDRVNKSSISLARELIQRIYHSNKFSYIGCFQDCLPRNQKTTRIWKETKGNATNIDHIIVLSKKPPVFHSEALAEFLKIDSCRYKIDPSYLLKNAQDLAGI
jgi:hypothetical protein